MERLVWRLRPLVGAREWLIFETTTDLVDWLTVYGTNTRSFEIQLVPMTDAELEQLPSKDA